MYNPIFISDNINKLKSNTTKFCGHCKLEKNKEEFNNSDSWCIRCKREYNKNYYRSHKKERKNEN